MPILRGAHNEYYDNNKFTVRPRQDTTAEEWAVPILRRRTTNTTITVKSRCAPDKIPLRKNGPCPFFGGRTTNTTMSTDYGAPQDNCSPKSSACGMAPAAGSDLVR